MSCCGIYYSEELSLTGRRSYTPLCNRCSYRHSLRQNKGEAYETTKKNVEHYRNESGYFSAGIGSGVYSGERRLSLRQSQKTQLESQRQKKDRKTKNKRRKTKRLTKQQIDKTEMTDKKRKALKQISAFFFAVFYSGYSDASCGKPALCRALFRCRTMACEPADTSLSTKAWKISRCSEST